ncbi:hypothetical protein ACFL03_02080 [Thermodesulfobacteriota bacterium]
MRILRYKRAITVIVSVGLLLAFGTIGSIALAYDSVDYFPLEIDNSWDYIGCEGSGCNEDDLASTWSVNKTVISTQEKLINGVLTAVIQTLDGDEEYFTNDDAGLRRHGYTLTDFPSGNETCGDATIFVTLDPPITYANPVMILGEPADNNRDADNPGSASFKVKCAGGTVVPFNSRYHSTSVPQAKETVRGPLGTFRAIRVVTTIVFSDKDPYGNDLPDPIQTNWLVKGLGPVKYIDELGGNEYIQELDGTNLPIPRAMPWIPLLLLGD